MHTQHVMATSADGRADKADTKHEKGCCSAAYLNEIGDCPTISRHSVCAGSLWSATVFHFIACSAPVKRLTTAMNCHVVTLLVLVCSYFQACAAVKWHQCSEGPFKPESVTLKPDPPKIGQEISFDIKGAYDPEGALHTNLRSLRNTA